MQWWKTVVVVVLFDWSNSRAGQGARPDHEEPRDQARGGWKAGASQGQSASHAPTHFCKAPLFIKIWSIKKLKVKKYLLSNFVFRFVCLMFCLTVCIYFNHFVKMIHCMIDKQIIIIIIIIIIIYYFILDQCKFMSAIWQYHLRLLCVGLK